MDEGDDDYFHSASHAEQMMLKMDAYFAKQQVLLIVASIYIYIYIYIYSFNKKDDMTHLKQ